MHKWPKDAESVEISAEDLRYLRDIAEQKIVNRFTTNTIKIDMTNNNNVSSEADLDGILNALQDNLYEAMSTAAEGDHK